ncbi:hypothetical protein VI817_001826 [Penicillium citrinum]|nr:hypothetical protein VI817_001826 [Penicillium citrinum]
MQPSERRLKYQGVARVKISDIQFTDPQKDFVDQKNIQRLCKIFRKARCQRFELVNYVPAMVSRQALAEAIQNAGISARSLLLSTGMDIPMLSFPRGQLIGLHGRHRLYAGAKVLAPTERWWTVDIYLDDLSEELKTSISEEYSSEKQLADGEIYRKIRQYESEGNRILRQKWVMRLPSDSKRKRLEQLGKEKNERLRCGFDKLLAIPGLWLHGMRIGMLHRVIALTSTEVNFPSLAYPSRCEILNYLDHIYDTYLSFVGGHQHALRSIDTESVLKLQLKAPGNCEQDTKELMGLILSGQIFSSFGESDRKQIWKRIKEFDGVIPSLETFWDDFLFFEQCAQCMRWLFGVAKDSIWDTMMAMFRPDPGENSATIQVSERKFRRQVASDAERLDLGYRQLWLYTMRHYNSMPRPAKRKDGLLVKWDRGNIDERVVFKFAELARRLGFRSKEIENLLQRSPDRLIARNALLQARKPDYYQYDPVQFESLVDRISACFSKAVEYDRPAAEVLADSEVSARRRCGFPQEMAYSQDVPHLFLDQVHAEAAFAPITTYLVRRCFYYAFLGKRSLPCPGTGQSDPSVPRRDNSPLFVNDIEPAQSSPETIESISASESTRARPLYENSQTRRALEGYRSPYVEDEIGTEGAHSLEPEERGESPDDDTMASENESLEFLGEDEHNASPTNPLFNRQELRSSRSDMSHESDHLARESDIPSTPNESTSAHEDLESASQIPARDYSPSVYSTRRKSSIRESEARQRFSEDIARAMQERERIDEDWERERFEQEYGPSNPGEILEENAKPSEDHDLGQQQISLSIVDLDETRTGIEAEDLQLQQNPRVTRFDLGGSTPMQAGKREVPTKTHSPANDAPASHAQPSETPQRVEFKFWSYHNDEWYVSDRHWVDPTDPSIVERIAKKYMRKNFSIYDKSLNSLSPIMCFRAGVADGTHAVFVLSKQIEAKLVAEGRFRTSEGIPKNVKIDRRIRRATKPKPNKRLRLRRSSSSKSESL